VDLHLPAGDSPAPAVVFVHGGPVRDTTSPTPRDWPSLVGYGRAVAARGAVGVVLDHRLRDLSDYGPSAQDLADAVETVRAHPRVDGDRIALWFLSGGSCLAAGWLDAAPDRLRCIAFSYPLLADAPGLPVDARFRPVAALAGWRGVPIVLTSVGLERPHVAATVDQFLAAAGERRVDVRVITVPNGHHAFDCLDDTDESREAIVEAIDAVLGYLGG
jgi:dienelactone hydrolase